MCLVCKIKEILRNFHLDDFIYYCNLTVGGDAILALGILFFVFIICLVNIYKIQVHVNKGIYKTKNSDIKGHLIKASIGSVGIIYKEILHIMPVRVWLAILQFVLVLLNTNIVKSILLVIIHTIYTYLPLIQHLYGYLMASKIASIIKTMLMLYFRIVES